MRRIFILFLFLTAVPVRKLYGQENSSSSFPLKCFSETSRDSFEVEIKGLGSVLMHSMASADTQDIGLFYYIIPDKARGKSNEKLARLAAGFQTETWKNNSRIVSSKQYNDGPVTIVDTRLHLLIEDIYLQVIIICDGMMVFEIDSFRDTHDSVFFDRLLNKVRKKDCP